MSSKRFFPLLIFQHLFICVTFNFIILLAQFLYCFWLIKKKRGKKWQNHTTPLPCSLCINNNKYVNFWRCNLNNFDHISMKSQVHVFPCDSTDWIMHALRNSVSRKAIGPFICLFVRFSIHFFCALVRCVWTAFGIVCTLDKCIIIWALHFDEIYSLWQLKMLIN